MYNLKTTATVNKRTFNVVATILFVVLVSAIAYALITGDINGFNNTYLG